MPITPLHLGLLAPLNHWLPGKVNNLSFLLVTLWLDSDAIAYFAFGLERSELHGPETHSFIAAMAMASVVGILGFAYYVIKEICRPVLHANQERALAWILGTYLGCFSHILLDSLVHPEMQPLYPVLGNPFYTGWMLEISLLLTPLLAWFIAQHVSTAGEHLRTVLAGIPVPSPEPCAARQPPVHPGSASAGPGERRGRWR